jgi:outer membrane protein assembly factor BamD
MARSYSSLHFATWVLLILAFQGCSVDNARNHYVLAEKLWMDRNYSAAVSEFEKVISKDPRGKLGLQATYRAAMTQNLFLGQYNDAIRKFKGYIQASADPTGIWEAELQIADVLYSKTENYVEAISQYQSLLHQRPLAREAPEFLFRVAKSHFYLFQFNEAVSTYLKLIKKYPHSAYAEKAMYEIGLTYFTRGEQGSEESHAESEAYEDAIHAFEKFIKLYPQSRWVPEAQFGIASCKEELDQLDDAYDTFSSLKSTYPSPNVIEIKLIRIRERLAQRKTFR